jgi:hypothetical protein
MVLSESLKQAISSHWSSLDEATFEPTAQGVSNAPISLLRFQCPSLHLLVRHLLPLKLMSKRSVLPYCLDWLDSPWIDKT